METISRLAVTFLLNAAWQIPVIAIAAWIICRLMGRAAARYRYQVLVAAVAISFVLPVASTWPRREVQMPSPRAKVSQTAPGLAMQWPTASTTVQNVWLSEPTISVLFAAYLLLIAFRIAGLVRAAGRTLDVYRGAREKVLSSNLELVIERCEDALNFQDARVLFSNEVASPISIGRGIILPEELWASTSNELLTAAVGHEMAHVARRDFGWNIVVSLLCVPICFHPVTRLLTRAIGRAREMSCDELVALHLLEARTYACNLTALAAALFPAAESTYSLSIFDGNALEARIHNLLDAPRLDRSPRLAMLAALMALAACVLVCVAFSLRADAAASVVPSEQEMADVTPPPPPPEAPPPPPGWKGTLPAPPLVGGMPPMPEVAQTGASGLVQLSVAIAKDGSVQSVEPIQGPPPLIPPLARSVRKLIFQPTIVNGVPVDVTTMLTFRILPRP